MDPKTQLQYFRKEHQDIHRFIGQFGAALDSFKVSRTNGAEKDRDELRELQAELQAIQHHCDSEERNLESPTMLTCRRISSRLCDRNTSGWDGSHKTSSPNFSLPRQIKPRTFSVRARSGRSSCGSISLSRRRC